MALQDVCGFHYIPLSPPWNIPFLSSSTFCPPGMEKAEGSPSRWRHLTRSSCPLEFHIPVPEYLTENPIQFGQVRPVSNSLADDLLDDTFMSSSVALPFPLGHGTTTLGFAFQGGVIAAADSRSSCSGLVACPASQKILPVHSHLVGTTSGTSADCALWKRILARELRLYQLRHRRRLSVGGAAKLLSHMLHPFKGTELCVAATLCGWDGDSGDDGDANSLCEPSQVSEAPASSVESFQPGSSNSNRRPASSKNAAAEIRGPRVVYVCSDGLRLKGALFSVGSGSPYAYSILDERVRWDLSVDEAVSVAREAVYRATYRDAYSGNNVDLYHVTAKGWRCRTREDLKEEYYREKERERKRVELRRRETEGTRQEK